MHAEITRLVTAWLKNESYGVNALLPGIPRYKVETPTSQDEQPKAVTIYNDIDFELDDVAGFQPAKTPALAVIADTNPDGTDIGQVFKPGQTFGFTVGVGYYAEETGRARARRDGNYVMRAVSQSLVRFNQAPVSARTVNEIQITRFTKLTTQRVAGAVPSSTLLGLVFVDGLLLNKAP